MKLKSYWPMTLGLTIQPVLAEAVLPEVTVKGTIVNEIKSYYKST